MDFLFWFVWEFIWKYIQKSFQNTSEDFFRIFQNCSLISFRDFSLGFYRIFFVISYRILPGISPGVLPDIFNSFRDFSVFFSGFQRVVIGVYTRVPSRVPVFRVRFSRGFRRMTFLDFIQRYFIGIVLRVLSGDSDKILQKFFQGFL